MSLTVSVAGSGAGSVSGGGISCPGTCGASVAPGTQVTLTATPASGSSFAGWSGSGCSGTSTTCQTTVNSAETVTATFTPAARTGGGGPRPSTAQVKAALSKVLKPSGKAAKLAAIVKAGGYTLSFAAPRVEDS
ncbi:MAG: InlB B-repeat-containing protein [Solirubrobacteraceae bacterium]